MKRTLPVVEFFMRHKEVFHAAKNTLQVISQARGGGPLSKVLAGMSALGFMSELLLPDDDPWALVLRHGYQRVSTPIDGFIGDALARSDIPRTTMKFNDNRQLLFWSTAKGEEITACYTGGDFTWGPLVKTEHGNSNDVLARLAQKVFWKDTNALMLSVNMNSHPSFTDNVSRDKFRLIPMPEPGPYIGKRTPQALAERLRRYGNVPRTVLLQGPTGVGKSVMARHLARELSKGQDKTLKIAADVVNKCTFVEILAFVDILQPTILLLDDLDLSNPDNTEGFLTLLEALRSPNCLVIVTMMTDSEPSREPQPGDWHFPGMRPGRIDEIFAFHLPDKEERKAILTHYFQQSGTVLPSEDQWDGILEATERLSGAYLGEVARRISVHGLERWKEEIANVKLAAPAPKDMSDNPPKAKPDPTEGKHSPAASKHEGKVDIPADKPVQRIGRRARNVTEAERPWWGWR